MEKIIEKLGKGLDRVDKEKVKKLVKKNGLYEAARILGYDIEEYENLEMAGRLAIEDLKTRAAKNMEEYVNRLGNKLNKNVYNYIKENHKELDDIIIEEKDYDHDWFSANTIITMYSIKEKYGEKGIETPQQIWLRIAIQLYYKEGIKKIKEAYEEMAEGYYTPASPTIFNAGLKKPQMASCFILSIEDDLESILKMGIYRGGLISKANGGLGFDVSKVRHSEINETGWSSGIIPMLQLYNYMIRYVDQGGKRKGAATIFLRPHHIDVEDFIELPRKVGDKYARAHDLNICLWTSWIFWERIKNNENWTLFCPAYVPQLNDVYGEQFTKEYIKAENNPNIGNKYKKVINARKLYEKIINIQRECGMPYLMNGDAANIKSNHRHLGYIKSSNLCLEIVEYTDNETIAVCNLHSLSLRKFGIKKVNREIKCPFECLRESVNFKHLALISRKVVNNLNKVIDNNWYPLDKIMDKDDPTKIKPKIINKSNKKHRPVGMGVSGFAELLHILDLPFEDELVLNLNKMIFACMYWNALAQSIQLSILDGPYESFKGSPTSQGLLQFDLWKEEFNIIGGNAVRSKQDDEPLDPILWGQSSFPLYDKNNKYIDSILPSWDSLKYFIILYGLRNSLLIALMPTATTAQIRRNCESVEAPQNNLYSRKVLKYSYPVLNRYLVNDFISLNIWNSNTIEYLRINNGSIRNISLYISSNKKLYPHFSSDSLSRLRFLELKYKTMWELPQKLFLKLSADRCRYVDQSASTNIFIKDCTDAKLRACHLYANMLGLKTIMYYLRQTGGETIKFTADPSLIKNISSFSNLSSDFVHSSLSNVIECNDTICTSCT